MPQSLRERLDRGRAQAAAFVHNAQAAVIDGYGEVLRAGAEFAEKSAAELREYGQRMEQRLSERPTAPPAAPAAPAAPRPRPAAPPARAPARPAPGRAAAPTQTGANNRKSAAPKSDRQLRDELIWTVGGEIAQASGWGPGVVRGGLEAVTGLIQTADFARRFGDPLDRFLSPPGQSAHAQFFEAARSGVEGAKTALVDPRSVVRAMGRKAGQINREVNPTATPPAATLQDELRRRHEIGRNQGELLFDAGSLMFLGGPVKSLSKLVPTPASPASKYRKQGFSPAAADYLAEPYKGMGSHYIPRRWRPPELLPEGPYTPALLRAYKAFRDSDYNVLRPSGISRGDMYELHYRVDPHFYGAGLPARVGDKSWSGRRLELKKYGPLGQVWHGAPAPLKARVTGAAATAGGMAYEPTPTETPR